MLRKKKCGITEEWDYGKHSRDGVDSPYTQVDWNQTLVTMINKVSAFIYSKTGSQNVRIIEMHPHFKPLFETLVYYKKRTRELCGRYKVVYNSNLKRNRIFIYDLAYIKYASELKSLKYPSNIEEYTKQDELTTNTRNSIGYIKVLR
jgi:hypothetical protein